MRSAIVLPSLLGALGLAALAGCGGSRPSPISDDRPYIQTTTAQVVFEAGAFGSAPLAPATVDVGVANGGAQAPSGAPVPTVAYDAGEGWLRTSVAAAPYGWAITLAPAGAELLEAGTYHATVQVAWAGASNSPVTIDVRLVVHPHPGMWQAGQPSIATTRYLHTTTALTDGGAVVIGGKLAEASIERLAAATGVWSSAGTLQRGRQEHTATLLESGQVLVAGGRSEASGDDPPEATWELYDPDSGTVTAGGALQQGRYAHAAVLLSDGRVLLVGGWSGASGVEEPTRSCELFDPWTLTSTPVGSLHGDASRSTAAARLADDRVLVTDRTSDGGEIGAELYDPVTRRWTQVEPRLHPRTDHALVALADGRALAVGGLGAGDGGAASLLTAEVFDPATGRWSEAGTLRLPHAYVRDDAVLLPRGEVLVAGGLTDVALAYTSAVEVFDPAAGTWSLAGALGSPRGFHTITVLADGRVMSVGGWPSPDHGPEFWDGP